MRNLAGAAVVAALAVLPSLAHAWSADGHRIIADIAARELSPQARAAVDQILAGRSMAEVSSWADEVRGQEAYTWSAPLHYVNVEPGAAAFDLTRDCPEAGCAVKAITDEIAALKDPATPADKREEALKFLIHFVGDLHQPLHASFERDRGGNSIQVEANGIPMNLHKFWDVATIEAAQKDWQTYASDLFATITPEQRGAWSSLDPAVWANESYQLAVAVAYPIPADGKLDQVYITRSADTARTRLAMGGERLAAVLNSIYTPPPSAEPAPSVAPSTAAE
jgi:nuclease S1